jgi:hypothetical protein
MTLAEIFETTLYREINLKLLQKNKMLLTFLDLITYLDCNRYFLGMKLKNCNKSS